MIQYEMGDGMVFQWILASGIFMFGLFFYMGQCHISCSLDGATPSCSMADDTQTCPPISTFAMLGGVLWATGNVLTVSIIKTLGLATGMLTWGVRFSPCACAHTRTLRLATAPFTSARL